MDSSGKPFPLVGRGCVNSEIGFDAVYQISNPIAVTLSASLGILSTAAVNLKFGTSIW